MKINDSEMFSTGLGDMLRGYSQMVASSLEEEDEEPNLFFKAADELENLEEFFTSLSDILQATATMPLPYSFGLNGNPELLLKAIPDRQFHWIWASMEGDAAKGITFLWRKLCAQLKERGGQNLETGNVVVATVCHPGLLDGEFFDEVLGTVRAGFSDPDEVLRFLAKSLREEDDVPEISRLVGFVEDARMHGRIRFSAWFFQRTLRSVK
jgi:hypothetical protein